LAKAKVISKEDFVSQEDFVPIALLLYIFLVWNATKTLASAS
jgi:hypothetical protein